MIKNILLIIILIIIIYINVNTIEEFEDELNNLFDRATNLEYLKNAQIRADDYIQD